MINTSININVNGLITTGENDIPVLNINSSLNKDNTNFTLGFNVINKEVLAANQADVQTQFNSFLADIKAKMIEQGYLITI